MWFILCIVLCSQSIWSEAQKCDDYQNRTIHQIDQYVGTWYGIKKLNGSSDCVVFRINKTGPVFDIQYDKRNVSHVFRNLTMNKGVIDLKMQKFVLLETNSRDFTILLSCRDVNQTKSNQTVWVLSRNSSLTTNETNKAKEILDTFGINFDKLVNINQNRSVCHVVEKNPVPTKLNETISKVPNTKPTSPSKSNGSATTTCYFSFYFMLVIFCLVLV